jgi:hypothetical protein
LNLQTAASTAEIAMPPTAVHKFSKLKECIEMIKPCSQPLKINPFTSYRDPTTGKWTVVPAVQNVCETDSSLKPKAESEQESKVETSLSAVPAISLPKKRFSFSLLGLKNLAKKSSVTVSS